MGGASEAKDEGTDETIWGKPPTKSWGVLV